MTQNLFEARRHVEAITGNPDTPVSFRMFHDQDNGIAGRTRHGTANALFEELRQANNEGFGVFITVNETNLQGAKLENMTAIRAQFIDLDGLDAQQQLNNACDPATMPVPPSLLVNSSPGKCHVYWRVEPHQNFDLFTQVQRRLITKFNSDVQVVDVPRVMRLAGFYHLKGASHLVTCQTLAGATTKSDALDIALWNSPPYQSAGGAGGERITMGEGERAPDLATAIGLLFEIDVREMTDRNQWLALTGALMQSVDPSELPALRLQWDHWGSFYPGNDLGANDKVWRDFIEHGTTVRGYSRLYKEARGMTPAQAKALNAPIVGRALLDAAQAPAAPVVAPVAPTIGDNAPVPVSMAEAPTPTPAVDPTTGFATLLDPYEQSIYFKGCVMISTESRILCADNCFRGPTDFNMKYGGKDFIINDSGKPVSEAWKAVIQNQKYRMMQVQFTSFRPMEPQRSVTQDELGRDYVNTYLPATIEHREGDVTPFFNHMAALFPNEDDRNHLFAFLAHNIKFPGYKVFWSPLVQGAEGMGKNLIKRLMEHAMGGMFFYQPSARDLADGGAKFNGWMENKLFFLVDEIKTDDRADIVEIMKPFITETKLEIQGKGKDQKMGDTPGNWLSFSNWKDALTITMNTRRHCILFSVMQDRGDLLAAGLTDDYFKSLYDWFDNQGGVEFVTHWMMNHPITEGGLPTRAPHTTSTKEACSAGRGNVANIIAEAISNNLAGFRGGWVSTSAVARVFRDSDMKTVPTGQTIGKALRELDYHKIGQLRAGFMTDDPQHPEKRPVLYNINKAAALHEYGAAQGANYM